MNEGIFGFQNNFEAKNSANLSGYNSVTNTRFMPLGYGNSTNIPLPFHYGKKNNWKYNDNCTIFTVDTFGSGMNIVITPLSPQGGQSSGLIDWGDNTTTNMTGIRTYSHYYSVPGQYDIILTADPSGVGINAASSSSGNITKVIKIDQRINNTSNIIRYLPAIISLPKNYKLPINVSGMLTQVGSSPANINQGLTRVPVFTNIGFNDYYLQDVSSWDIASCTGLQMFFQLNTALDCDLNCWDVSNITSLNNTFYGCNRFTGRGVQNWDPLNVTDFDSTFRFCTTFDPDLSNWKNIGKISETNMNSMFFTCSGFTGKGLENWNPSGVTDFGNMFASCPVFNTNLSGWVGVGKISGTNMLAMFSACGSFIGSGLENWNPSGATSFSNMFINCRNFNANLSGWVDVGKISGTNMSIMFTSCTPFRGSGLENWNPSGTTSFTSMFSNCSNFNTNLSGWVGVGKISGTNMQSMFLSNSAFRGSGLENWSPSGTTNFSSMFSNCFNFNTNLSGWADVGKIRGTNMLSMFQTNSAFRGSGLENWNPNGVTNFNSMLASCSNFNTNLSGWVDVGKISGTNMGSMFSSCTSFRGSGLQNWNPSGVTNFSAMLNGCPNFNTNLSGWADVGKINGTDMANMFNGCSSFTGSGLENWNPSGTTNFNSMFINCRNFNANLSGWADVGKISGTNMTNMFNGCYIFAGSGLENWNPSGTTLMTSMFSACSGFGGSGLENWNLKNLNSSTSLDSFASGCTFSSGQYDLILNTWNTNKSGWYTPLSPHFGNSKYTAAGSGARAALITYGWTITDGGLQT